MQKELHILLIGAINQSDIIRFDHQIIHCFFGHIIVGVGAKRLIVLILIYCISIIIFKESSVGASEMVDYYSNDGYEQQQNSSTTIFSSK
jgi:hypothetical protein